MSAARKICRTWPAPPPDLEGVAFGVPAGPSGDAYTELCELLAARAEQAATLAALEAEQLAAAPSLRLRN